MKHLLTPLCTALLLTACAGPAAPEKTESLSLTEGWVLDGFDSPESVIPDGQGGYFVSSVNGEGSDKDGNGYISRISSDGKMITHKWAEGVDAPKGMALWGGTLYVADIDRLVMFDATTGEITDEIIVPDAKFLNDVAANKKGVFVSDSNRARIHRLDEDGTLPVWLADERLKRINGVLPQDSRLLVNTMAAGELLSVSWEDKSMTRLAAGMENGDGMAERRDGSFMLSSWPGKIWHVRTGETPNLLLDTSGEIGITHNDTLFEENRILSPSWSTGTVREYQIIVEK